MINTDEARPERRFNTSVTLDPEQVTALDRVAKEQCISRSAVIRQLVQKFVRESASDERQAA